MKIDLQTGDVYLERFGQIVWNGITEDDLKETKFYQDNLQKEWQAYERVLWYIFKPVSALNQELSISYIYVDHILDHITFKLSRQEGDPTGWDDWSEEKELEIMLRYGDFFGQLPNMPKPKNGKYWRSFEFGWGGLYSRYDSKSQCAVNGLYYNPIEPEP